MTTTPDLKKLAEVKTPLESLTKEDREMIDAVIDGHYEVHGSAVKGDLHGSLYAAGKQSRQQEVETLRDEVKRLVSANEHWHTRVRQMKDQQQHTGEVPGFVLPLHTARVVRNVFLPRNPNKLRGAHPDVVTAAKIYIETLEKAEAEKVKPA